MSTARHGQLRNGVRILIAVVLVATAEGAISQGHGSNPVEPEGADVLFKEFLRIRNLRDGVEFVGGPFKPVDYLKNEQAPMSNDGAMMRYHYKRPFGVAGDPDTVTIRVSRGWFFPKKDLPVSACCGVDTGCPAAALGLAEGLMRGRIPVPLTHGIGGPQHVGVQVVEMVREDGWRLRRHSAPAINVRRCERVGPDMCVVYYGRSYADFNVFHYYADWIVDRATLRPSYADEGDPIPAGLGLSRQQSFLLYLMNGPVADEELIALARVLEGIAPSPVLSAVVVGEGSIRVSFGEARMGFPFGSIAHAEPIARAKYRIREGTWDLLGLATVEDVRPTYDSPPLALFFRPDIPVSSDMVRTHLARDEWEEGLVASHLTDQDLCEIYRIAVRCRLFPLFRRVSLEMRDPEGVYVWPQSGDFVPRCLYLCKVKGRWRINWDGPF